MKTGFVELLAIIAIVSVLFPVAALADGEGFVVSPALVSVLAHATPAISARTIHR